MVVYTSGWCPYCQRALALLANKGAEFTTIDVDDDAKLRAQMIERSGRRTVPQIFIGDRHVGGCDDLLGLDGSGELDRLLQGA